VIHVKEKKLNLKTVTLTLVPLGVIGFGVNAPPPVENLFAPVIVFVMSYKEATSFVTERISRLKHVN